MVSKEVRQSDKRQAQLFREIGQMRFWTEVM